MVIKGKDIRGMDIIRGLIAPPIITTIVSAVIGVLIGALATRYHAIKKEEEQKIKQNELLIEGMKWLLHQPLETQCDYWIDKNEVDMEAYNNLEAQYKIYKGLGGNGDIERRMLVIRKLKKTAKGRKNQ